MNRAIVKNFSSLCLDGSALPASWELKILVNEDNLTYLAFHLGTREAIWVDPLTEDLDLTLRLSKELGDYRFVAVIDTHTHADHLSSAGDAPERPLFESGSAREPGYATPDRRRPTPAVDHTRAHLGRLNSCVGSLRVHRGHGVLC